jgi:hypothetical protein
MRPRIIESSTRMIAGQAFDGTTNGLLTGTAVSPQVTPASGVYTISVADGTAAMLTVPQ